MPSNPVWLLHLNGGNILVTLPEAAPELRPTPGLLLWVRLNADGSLSVRAADTATRNVSGTRLPTATTPLPIEALQVRLEQLLTRSLQQQLPFPVALLRLNQARTSPEASTETNLHTVLQRLAGAILSRAMLPDQSLSAPSAAPHAPSIPANAAVAMLRQALAAQGLEFERQLYRNLAPARQDFTSFSSPGVAAPAGTPNSTPDLHPWVRAAFARLSHAVPDRPATPPIAPAPAGSLISGAGDVPLGLTSETARSLQQLLQTIAGTPITEEIPLPAAPRTPGTLLAAALARATAPVAETNQPAPMPDLKGTLIGLLRELGAAGEKGASADKGAPNISPNAHWPDQFLLRNPLGFPHPMSDLALLKSSAMLAERELDTGQLLRLLAGMLHRIQFNQLNSLLQTASNSSDTVSAQSWLFDLPVSTPGQQFDFFQLRLDREQHREDTAERATPERAVRWKIALAFDFEQLGPIHIQVTVRPPTASSVIWAGRAQTLSLLQQHAQHFERRLTALGLAVEAIQYQQGEPRTEQRPIQSCIVDTRA
jgi:hypothetical protein